MRTSPAVGPLRIARSGLLVVVAFALASLAHTAGGGRLPSPLLLVPLAVPVTCLAYLLTGRLVSLRSTALLMSLLQLVLHQAFSILGGHGNLAAADLEGFPAPHSHLHATAGIAPNLSSVGGLDGALAPHPGFGSGAAVVMLALHVLATALTVVALAGTERAVWRVWAWLRPLFVLLVQLARFQAHRRTTVVVFAVSEPVLRRIGRRCRRRGPPPSNWSPVPA